MRYLLAPIFFLYKLWVGLIFWTTLLLLYPLFYYLLKKERFQGAFKLKRFWSKLIQLLILAPVKSQWNTVKPEPPYIICSNHSSYLDTVYFFSVFPDYFLFVGKGELLKWPLFRLFFRKMDIPVVRENYRKAYGALQKASDAIQKGSCIAIYPEGTVPRDSPKLGNFKNGPFKLAIDNQVPILPVTWTTNYRIMADPEKMFSWSLPGISRVVIHPPIETKGMGEDDLVTLRQSVRTAIQSGLQHLETKT